MSRGSAGNVIAGLASFFIPGFGQLLQGRFLKALFMFVMTWVMWLILLGWVVHLWSILDAVLYEPENRYIPERDYRRWERDYRYRRDRYRDYA